MCGRSLAWRLASVSRIMYIISMMLILIILVLLFLAVPFLMDLEKAKKKVNPHSKKK